MSDVVWLGLGAGAWWSVGAVSFVYWWTKDDDFEWRHVPLAMLAGAMGPWAFVVGWAVHGDGRARPLVRRRTQEPSRPFMRRMK